MIKHIYKRETCRLPCPCLFRLAQHCDCRVGISGQENEVYDISNTRIDIVEKVQHKTWRVRYVSVECSGKATTTKMRGMHTLRGFVPAPLCLVLLESERTEEWQMHLLEETMLHIVTEDRHAVLF
jgi:hypothetical protein